MIVRFQPNVSTHISETIQYTISRKSIQRFSSCYSQQTERDMPKLKTYFRNFLPYTPESLIRAPSQIALLVFCCISCL
jgi:hypothetical protein